MGGVATKHLGTQRIPQHRYDEIIVILGEFDCRPAKTTKRKLAWVVGRLKEAGFQDQDLVKCIACIIKGMVK